MLDAAWWLFVALAIAGTACVSILKRVRMGHALWTASNAGLLALCLADGKAPMAVLFAVYLLLSLWGRWRWRNDA
ncbi:MAG: hypothetical protein M5U26_08325 [Planctomycetota bacterium]|nr:hypothetical protein [Planctomycetota bacterium]